MNIVSFDSLHLLPVNEFGSRRASAQELGHGSGEAHAFVVHLERGGVIGPHAAGFGQLWAPVEGAGWIAGADGARHTLRAGEVAFISKGETHSKGSDQGMTAVMVQIREFTPLVVRAAV